MPDDDLRSEWRREVRARLEGVDTADADNIVQELSQHLADRYRELVSAGTSDDDARRVVLDELAARHVLPRALRPVVRPSAPPRLVLGQPGGRWRSGLGRDVLHGIRALRASPFLALVVLLTLAIGIGANVAIFSVVNAAMLRPLPLADPDRLVTFWGSAPAMGLPVVNYPDALFLYVHRRTHALDSVAAYTWQDVTLTTNAGADRLQAVAVTTDFFRVLGRSPAAGRSFLPEEHVRHAGSVVILSDGLWKRRFGSDRGLLGTTITLDGKPALVAGVMPPGFDFPTRTDLWMPLPLDPASLDCWCYETVGRLAAGQTAAMATRELAGLNDDFWLEREGKPRKEEASTPESIIVTQPLARHLLGDVRTPLLVLSGAVAMVLLIACANIANLLLARANARTRELAMRCCLGASPWRIARQMVVESALLATTGAAAGLGLGAIGAKILGRVAADRLSYVGDVGIDPLVVLFAIGATIVTVLLFGVAPAIRGARVDLQEATRDGGRATRGASARRLSDVFVVAQLALSLVLLIGAGLLMRSFGNLLAVDPGFRAPQVLVGRVTLPPGTARSAAESQQETRAFFGSLVERLGALPGVAKVGLSSSAPFSTGGNGQIFTIQGREPGKDEPKLVANVRAVTSDYFATIGTAMRRGRTFDPGDAGNAPPVAVVDETLARRFWPDGSAVGHLIRLGDNGSWRTIVGVVAAVKDTALGVEANRYVYVPFAQASPRSMDLVVRSGIAPEAQIAAIRQSIRALNASVPFYDVHTLQDAVERSLTNERLTNALLLAFACAAALLAAIGVYGVMAVGVGERVGELAIRLALGATPPRVVWLMMRHGLRLVTMGVAIGLAGAAGVSRYLQTLLFDVTPTDPYVFGVVTALLVIVAIVACLIPARRAMTVDPQAALRKA
jgi:predicted permease